MCYLYFNSIKVRLKLYTDKQENATRLFQFHKGTIKTLLIPTLLMLIANFNSIKVRLKPVKSKAYTPEDFIGLRVQKYKKNFRKMSMPKDIFSAALRQLAYLWRFQ